MNTLHRSAQSLAPSTRRWPLAVVVLCLIFAAEGSARARKKKHHPKTPAAHNAKNARPQSEAAVGVEPTEEAPKSAPQPAPSETATEAAADSPAKREESPADQTDGAGEADGENHRPTSKRAVTHRSERESDASESAPGWPPALRGGIRFGVTSRKLTWSGADPNMLAPYSQSSAPQIGVALEVFPAAFLGRGFGANIGAILAFDRGFGPTVNFGDAGSSSAIFEDFLVGLAVRFPIGIVAPYVSAAYAGQVYLFSPRVSVVPSVFYAAARFGAGASAHITDAVDLRIDLAYLAVVDPGTQSGYVAAPEYLPGTSVGGFEAGGSIGARLFGPFGIRAGVEFRRYSLNTAQATGMLTAQSAVDQYVTFGGALEIVLDGAAVRPSSNEGDSDEEQAPKPPREAHPAPPKEKEKAEDDDAASPDEDARGEDQ